MFIVQRARCFAALVVFVLATLAAPTDAARAADYMAVSGQGTTVEHDGTVVHINVEAELAGSGVVSGRLLGTFRFPGKDSKPHTVNAKATCLRTFGSLAIVGGVVVNNAPSADSSFSHFVLILEDGGQASDRVGTVRFVGFPPESDPCAAIAPFVDFISRAPLEKGDVSFSH
jgi:hypothetical protein